MAQRATDLIGKPVVSADGGEKLGTVSDLLLDDQATHLVGLVVKRGMLHGEDVLPASAVQTLGRDAIVSRSNELVSAKEWRIRERQDNPPERDPQDYPADRDRPAYPSDPNRRY
jgi:uncharacterized protein YrrD